MPYIFDLAGGFELPPPDPDVGADTIQQYLSIQQKLAVDAVTGIGKNAYYPAVPGTGGQHGLLSILGLKRAALSQAVNYNQLQRGPAKIAWNHFTTIQKPFEEELKKKFKRQFVGYLSLETKEIKDHVFSTLYGTVDSTLASTKSAVVNEARNTITRALGEHTAEMFTSMAGMVSSAAPALLSIAGSLAGPLVGMAVGAIVQGIMSLFREKIPTRPREMAWVKDYFGKTNFIFPPVATTLGNAANTSLDLIDSGTTWGQKDAIALTAHTAFELTDNEREDLANYYWHARLRQVLTDYVLGNKKGSDGTVEHLLQIISRQNIILSYLGSMFHSIQNKYEDSIDLYREVSAIDIISKKVVMPFPMQDAVKTKLNKPVVPQEFFNTIEAAHPQIKAGYRYPDPWKGSMPSGKAAEFSLVWHGKEVLSRYQSRIYEIKYPPQILFLEAISPKNCPHSAMVTYYVTHQQFVDNIKDVMTLKSGRQKSFAATGTLAATTAGRILARKQVFKKTREIGQTIQKAAPAIAAIKAEKEAKAKMLKTLVIAGAAAGGLYLLTRKKK